MVRPMKLSRRKFLFGSGAALGTGALASLFPWPFRKLSSAEAAQYTDYASGAWIPSCCNMCGGQCGTLVYLENGRVRKIEPNAANPNNVANVSTKFSEAQQAGDLGRLCCKGNAASRSVYDPDRLTMPLKRIGPRGSGQYKAISWQEAIAEAAAGLWKVQQQYGARSIVWFAEDHSFNAPQLDIMDALGSPNFSNHANLCDTARKAHYVSTIGHDRPLADMEQTDYLLVFGWNFLSAIKWIHLAAIFTRVRANNPNFTFTYVDPVFNTTASKADRWMAPRPGTDGALALALCKILIDQNTYNTSFVQNYTLGFDEFVKYLNGDGTYDNQPKSALWAAQVTGIPETEIVQLAQELGAAYSAGRKICIDVWSGPGHHTNATQGGRAINALNLLLGAVDLPGTMLVPLRNGPSRRAAVAGWPAKDGWRVDGRDDVVVNGTPIAKKYSHSHGSGIYVETRERMLEQKDFAGNPYPIKAAVFVFQNFVMSVPNTQRNIDAIEKMDFVLSVDTHLSETAILADLIIPGSHFLERFDFNPNWVSFRSIGLRQPVIPSWIGGVSETQFFLELGAALGLPGFKTTPGLDDTEENYHKEMWDRFMTKGNGGNPWNNQVSWDQLKASGVWIETGATGGTVYQKYLATKTFVKTGNAAVDDQIVAFGAGAQTVYVVKSADGKTSKGIASGPMMNHGDTYVVGFGTESRRAQFWSPKLNACYSGAVQPGGQSVAGDLRYHPLPYYLAPEDAPDVQFPNYFISWKEVEHTHTRSFTNDWLMEMKRENKLHVHPTLAAQHGLTEDDWAYVQTKWGIVRVRVHLTAGIQPETVGFVRGFGHWAFGKMAVGKGAHDGWLLPGKAEIHSGQAVHKEAACRIYKDL